MEKGSETGLGLQSSRL